MGYLIISRKVLIYSSILNMISLAVNMISNEHRMKRVSSFGEIEIGRIEFVSFFIEACFFRIR